MNRMLDLLYAGDNVKAFMALHPNTYCKYKGSDEWILDLSRDDLTTMLLLIAVAEGFEI